MCSAKGLGGGRGRRRRDEADTGETGTLIKRWIGATRRRAIRETRDSAGGGAQIITLTWAQTFGRPIGDSVPADGQGRAAETVILRPRSCA